MITSISALFCCIDDFAKVFEDCERKQLISTRRKRLRSGKLSLGEMLFIMVLFHVSPAIPDRFFLLFIIMLLCLLFKYLVTTHPIYNLL